MISVRVESIYSVGLAKILLDSGEDIQLISPNEELVSLLGVTPHVDTFDVHIGDLEDRSGLQIKGEKDAVDRVLSILRKVLTDSLAFRYDLEQDAVYTAVVNNFLPHKKVGFLDLGDGQTGVMFAPRLRTGLRMIVQVKELPSESGKFPVCSDQINLAGQYVILEKSRDGEFVRVSKKILGDLRDRMHMIGQRLRPSGFGLILRTSATEVGENVLAGEIRELLKIWDRAVARLEEGSIGKVTSGETLVTLLLHYETKLKLDEVRSKVQPVMPRYHAFKSYSVASGFGADYMLHFLDRVDRAEAAEVLEAMIMDRDYRVDTPLRAEFRKMDGTQQDFILGLIKEKGRIFRLRKDLDAYLAEADSSSFVVYEGDYIETFLAKGSWTVHYRYYSNDGSFIGDRIVVVTPIDLSFRGKVRTTEFGIEVYRDGQSGAIDVVTETDADLLNDGIITADLDIKLGEVMEKVLTSLRSSPTPDPIIIMD